MKKVLFAIAFLIGFIQAEAQNLNHEILKVSPGQTGLKSNFTKGISPQIRAVDVAEDELLLGYCNEGYNLYGMGYGRAATFHCAALFPEEITRNLTGSEITQIRIAIYSAGHLKGSQIWIRKNLYDDPVFIQDVTFQDGWNDFVITTPFMIDGSDLYVGYTTTLSAYSDPGPDFSDNFPIGFNSKNTVDNSFYFRVDDGSWMDYSQDASVLTLQCIVKGPVPQYNAAMTDIERRSNLTGQETTVEGTLFNCGKHAINSIDISYELDGVPHSDQISFSPAIYSFQKGDFTFDLTMPSESGIYDINVKIDKINGQANENQTDNAALGTLLSLSKQGNRKIVMEEFTGSWCGFCPRGAVAMERLAEDYPDHFVGVAIHSGDYMATSSYSPLTNTVFSFPSATLNRTLDCDPYYGTLQTNYGIKDDIDNLLTQLPVADISVDAVYADEDKTELYITSQVSFYLNRDDNPYRLAYVITEDNVPGTQKNYYTGESGLPDDLAFLSQESDEIMDYIFHDVARGIYDCMGIEGSLEGAVVENTQKTHTYTLSLPENILDKNNLSLVVFLLDGDTGEIVNANQISLKGIETGVAHTVANPLTISVNAENGILNVSTSCENTLSLAVYTADGKLIANKQFNSHTSYPLQSLKGTFIIRVTDGNNVAVKKVTL